MTDEVRHPKSVVIDGVEYKVGDKVPMPSKKPKLRVRPAKQQFIIPARRT